MCGINDLLEMWILTPRRHFQMRFNFLKQRAEYTNACTTKANKEMDSAFEWQINMNNNNKNNTTYQKKKK